MWAEVFAMLDPLPADEGMRQFKLLLGDYTLPWDFWGWFEERQIEWLDREVPLHGTGTVH